ncbi:MAG: F0F1 ATP synthase subunit epsilon, partial [Elioraea sp.]|nr:F0F1 ATP synthase subunit epsilon [Elioraea sp.]
MPTLTLDIVSPERLLFSDEVDLAEIPAAEGDMGVLAGHA